MRHLSASAIQENIAVIRQYPDVRKWVLDAINGEAKKPNRSLWRDAPTPEQASNARESSIIRLSRTGRNSRINSAVNRLTSCSDGYRCCSAACHECARLFQRALVRATSRLIRNDENKKGGQLVAITIIPADAKIAPGEFDGLDIQNFVRRLKTRLKGVSIKWAVGGVDFSFNEDRHGLYEPHWCPHVHIIGWTNDVDRLREDLRRLFPRDGAAIQRPTRVRKCDGTKYGISYQYKINFRRRVTSSKSKRRMPDYLRLTSDRKAELTLYLDKVGLASRLILIGVKAYVSSGRLKIARVGP